MKRIILVVFLFMFLIGNILSLDERGAGKVGENFTIVQICDNANYVTLDGIIYPDESFHEINVNMTKYASGTFTYNFTNTTTSGRYDAVGTSDGCAESGNNFAFKFDINPAGVESTDSRTAVIGRAVWFLSVISLILFIGFLFLNSKPPVKWTFFIISMMFFLQAVSILFTGMQDEVVNPKIESYFSFLATSSFILFWFAFGILAVLWIVTTFQTILFKKKQRQKEQFGG